MNLFFAVSIFLGGGYAALLLYYGYCWKSLPELEALDGGRHATENGLPLISVIIPARNEAAHLPGLLTSLQKQALAPEYFEVIVVDDFSSDNTAAIARSFKGVHCICLQDVLGNKVINSYKKKAIETGIAHSKGSLIVTTDADCMVGTYWLQTIAHYYNKYQPVMMVMPVAIAPVKKPIEIFQALDFLSLQGITGAAAYKNVLSMCNGANLAYSRKAFDAVNGFEGIDHIASGDDMLLMHKMVRRFPGKIAYIKSSAVLVNTAPVATVAQFMRQRIRWASKADKYEDKRIFWVLLLVYLFNVSLLVGWILYFVALLTKSIFVPWQIPLLILATKTIFELLFLMPVATFFGQQRLLWFFPVAQPFHILYTVLAGWLGKMGRYQWKDRQVK